MSYEHGSAGNRFNLPNPMKAENLVLGIAGGICAVLGLILLLVSRGRIENGGSVWAPLVLSLVLLIMGGTYVARTFSQLRFFFGRGLPRNLTQSEIQRGQTGNAGGADALKEILRHQALVFPEPQGPLNGLLYTAVPNLIYAPLPIQSLARQQFANAIKILLTLLLLGVALASGAASPNRLAWEVSQGWIGIVVLAYLLVVLFFSPSGAALDHSASMMKLSVKGLAIRMVLAVVVPVLLVQIAPSLPPLPVTSAFPHVFVLIMLALGGYSLIFFVLLREGNEPPATAVSQLQEAWSLNCHPGQVVGEFDRIMQDTWREQIPNRVYTRIDPVINPGARTGQFNAEMLEEFQPLPLKPATPRLGELLQDPKLRLLMILTIFSGLNLIVSGFCLFVLGLLSMQSAELATPWLVYGLMTGALAAGCHRVSHALWQRFDFGSILIFCEMKGQYVTAELQHGNIMRDSVKATSSVTQIESMTFRLWVAALHTVCFGKNELRYIRAMQPEDEAAKVLTEKLRHFTKEQAILLAPTSQADRDRNAHLQKLNVPVLVPENAVPTLAGQDTPTMRFCPSCGGNVVPSQHFCSGCGTALQPPV